MFFHIVDGLIANPPQPWTTIFASVTIFFQIYNIATASVSFVYRYLIICHNYELSGKQFLGLCLVAGLGPLAYSLSILISELGTRDLEADVAVMFTDTDWMDADGRIPAFGVMLTSQSFVSSFITPVTIIITYCIVAYCTIQISSKMWGLRAMQQHASGTNIRSQGQLQTVLYSQALIPFFTSGISTLAIQCGKILGFPQPWWLNLINTWSPVVNPLVVLLVITPYRRFLIHPFASKVDDSSTNGTIRCLTETTQHLSKSTKVVHE